MAAKKANKQKKYLDQTVLVSKWSLPTGSQKIWEKQVQFIKIPYIFQGKNKWAFFCLPLFTDQFIWDS